MSEIRDRVKDFRRVPARELAANPKNWRDHPRAQQTAMQTALEEIGFAGAALAIELPDGGLLLLDGHLRQELLDPDFEVPTLILDLTEEEADAALLTHDAIGEMYEPNKDALKRLLEGVVGRDARMRSLLESIRRQHHIEAPAAAHGDPEATPTLPPEATTKLGDLWRLGSHRLLCGDATLPADVERLMNRQHAELVFTDPPYGVSYATDNFEVLRNDTLKRGELTHFLGKAFQNMADNATPAAAFYIWHASATREEYSRAMTAAGLVELQQIIWVKPSLVLGRSDYQWQHEPCFYAARDGQHPTFYGQRSETTVWHVEEGRGPDQAVSIGPGVLLVNGQEELFVTMTAPRSRKLRSVHLDAGGATLVGPQGDSDVWQFSRDAGRAAHPTQKPVALAEKAIGNSGRAGAIVLDPFMGSGSTLIAAERTGMRAYGLELDPRYCDVIVRRWEEYSGQLAERN